MTPTAGGGSGHPLSRCRPWLGCFLLLASAWGTLSAGEPPPQATPPLRDLHSHCPWQPPDHRDAWETRAAALRLQLQVSLGLHPQPELPPVAAHIYGRVTRDDYTIEKVTFESLPGLLVTGNLYRPRQAATDQQLPAVLCPHGHWNQARFYAASPGEIKQLLATGAERFETAARNHIQARCVQLARMGCIVFHWDMLGYCDSQQISFARAHQFATQPPETELTEEGWLLFSPRAESHAQSVLGLQTLATQRAIDMLLTLPEVDPRRIAITGASGGGTQSFLGAALDSRLQVAFPAVMVSTGMQGGCTCENAALLRVGTNNVEIAALIAPRPLGLTAADDWTRTMPTDGFPELQQLYTLSGQPRNVQLFPALHFGHNFNHVSRVAMYGWLSDHLGLGWEKPVLERDFDLAEPDELTVWDAQHPPPEGGEDFERRLLQRWATQVDLQLTRCLHGDEAQQRNLRTILQEGWRVALGLTAQSPSPEAWSVRSDALLPLDPAAQVWRFERTDAWPEPPGERVAIVLREPERPPIVWTAEVPVREPQPLVDNPRRAAAYTYGYNLPQFARYAQQLAGLLAALRNAHPGKQLELRAGGAHAALAAAGLFCAQLTPLADEPALTLRIVPGGFRFADATSIHDGCFLPAARRYWDLPGLLAALEHVHVEYQAAPDEATSDSYERLSQLMDWSGHRLQGTENDRQQTEGHAAEEK